MFIQTNDEKLIAPERETYERVIIALRSQLNDESFTKVWAQGHAMTMDEAVAYALTDR
jgi:hypothetical protein